MAPAVARILGVALCLLAARTPISGPAAKQRVRLAVGSKPGNLVYLPLDLARALNYFAEEGLDVEFIHFDGGTDAALSLASGRADFSGNSIDHAIKLRSAGKDLKMIVSFTTLPTV